MKSKQKVKTKIPVKDKRLEKYAEFESDMYRAEYFVGVPHVYKVGKGLLEWCAPKLKTISEAVVKEYENIHGNYSSCAHPGCMLPGRKHKSALAVWCYEDNKIQLRKYLTSIRPLAIKDDVSGYVLIKGWEIDETNKGDKKNV